MTQFIIKISLTVGLAFTLAACSSNKVRDLATVSASNLSLASTQMKSFTDNSKKIAVLRADAIAELAQSVETRQAEFDIYRDSMGAAAAISGENKKPSRHRLLLELIRISDAVHARQVLAAQKEANFRKEVLASQAKLELPQESVKAIAKGLGDLSKKKDWKKHLKFLAEYFGEVKSGIDDAKSNAEDVVEDAEKSAGEANEVASN